MDFESFLRNFADDRRRIMQRMAFSSESNSDRNWTGPGQLSHGLQRRIESNLRQLQ